MSSAKRRIKKKIAMVVRMDAQYHRYWGSRYQGKRANVVLNMMVRGQKLSRQGYAVRGIEAVRAQRAAWGWK